MSLAHPLHPPEPRRCPQCSSMTCGIAACRFSGITNEEYFDWQNAEGPERVRVSEDEENARDDYQQRYRDSQ
jgi:hypothetical protein